MTLRRTTSIAIASVAFLSVLSNRDAHAATRSTRLVYVRSSDASSCVDEAGLRLAVAKRLGYDPFVAYSDTTIVVDVRTAAASSKDRFVAEVRIVKADGVTEGTRAITSANADCRELVDALALTLSIIVDPSSALRPPKPIEPPPHEEPKPDVEAPPPPTHEVAPPQIETPPRDRDLPKARSEIQISIAGFGGAGGAPSATGGGIVRAAIRKDVVSLAIEARADAPSSRDQGSTTIRSHVISGWIVPCANVNLLEGCAIVGAGGLFATSEGVASPRSDTGAYFAAGARIGANIDLSRRIFLHVFADGLVQPFRAQYEVNGADVYRLSPVAFDVGIGIGARFFP